MENSTHNYDCSTRSEWWQRASLVQRILQSSSSSGWTVVWTDVISPRRINYCIIVLEFSVWVSAFVGLCYPLFTSLLFGFILPTSFCLPSSFCFFFHAMYLHRSFGISLWSYLLQSCVRSLFTIIIFGTGKALTIHIQWKTALFHSSALNNKRLSLYIF